MRIKDLATRATKLLTGNAYMVFDNGTKVEKVDYAELAKQIITEYNTQTLAGSAQSVKSALDALNSNTYSLTLGTRLTGNVDLNTLTTVGNYYCDAAVTATNGPITSLLGIIKIEHSVGHDDNYLIQTYYSARNDADVYRRIRHNGNWGSWLRLPTRAEVDALNSNFACVSLGSVGSEAKTVASTDWVDIVTASNINLPAGKYMFIATVNATWSVSGYQFFPGIRVDSNNASSLYNYALPQTNQPVMIMGYLNVSAGTHTISLIGRVTNANKEVTIPAYQNIGIAFIHCA